MDEAIEWARDRIAEGWAHRDVTAELVDAGYAVERAEHIAERAAAGLEDAAEAEGGRRWLLPAALVLLLVAGGGAVATQPGLADTVMSALPFGGTPSFADLAEARGTYQVDYTIDEGNGTSNYSLAAASDGTWLRKTLSGRFAGQDLTATVHTSIDTDATLYCGDTFRSILGGDDTGCAHTALWAIVFPLMVTSARPFADDLDEINVTRRGSDTVAGEACERFTVDFALRHLYDEIVTDAQEEMADTTNTTIPGRAELCLDPGTGASLRTTVVGADPANGTLTITNQNLTITATAVERGGSVDAAPTAATVVTANCPGDDGEDGEVVMFARDTAGATLSVNGENRSVDLDVDTNERITLTPDDVQDGENEFVLYAGGGSASDTCRYGSLFG